MPLGLEDKRIAKPLVRASSFQGSYAPWRARLNQRSGWTASRNNRNQWIRIDLLAVARISGVATQGRSNGKSWVKTYTISYSKNSQQWSFYREKGRTKVLERCRHPPLKRCLAII